MLHARVADGAPRTTLAGGIQYQVPRYFVLSLHNAPPTRPLCLAVPWLTSSATPLLDDGVDVRGTGFPLHIPHRPTKNSRRRRISPYLPTDPSGGLQSASSRVHAGGHATTAEASRSASVHPVRSNPPKVLESLSRSELGTPYLRLVRLDRVLDEPRQLVRVVAGDTRARNTGAQRTPQRQL